MKKHPRSIGPTGKSESAMRRAVSSEDHTLRSRASLTSGSQQNATWDSRSSIRSSTATKMLFDGGSRRGSNGGVIPGQQLPEFPLPTLRTHAETYVTTVQEDEQLKPTCSKTDKDATHGRTGNVGRRNRSRIYDDPVVVAGYNSVPLLELDQLPRGGVSIETQSVGRVQVSYDGLYPHDCCFSLYHNSSCPCSLVYPRKQSKTRCGWGLAFLARI